MNVLKKFAVSLTALTTLATLGIGSFSVSANGLTTAKEKFIASYKNADEIKAANYYLENGLSVEEAEKLMVLYVDGKEAVEAEKNNKSRAINTGKNFYSDTNLSDNQHYGVVIANNGLANVYAELQLSYNSSWANISSSTTPTMFYNNQNMSYDTSTTNTIIMYTHVFPTTSSEEPSKVFEIPFNVSMTNGNNGNETFSEGTLYHKFSFNKNYGRTTNNIDTTFCYETYVRGDVNHDGIVNATDVYYLTEYNLQTLTDLSFTYTDKNNNIANIVNNLAADADKDGYIGLADLTWIQKNQD